MKRIYFCVQRNLMFVPLPPLFLLTSCFAIIPYFLHSSSQVIQFRQEKQKDSK